MLKTKVPISSQTISVLRSTCSSKETTRGWTLSSVKCATSLPTASGSDEKHEQNSDRICREITKLTFSFATYTSTNKQATQFTAILPGKCQKSDNITSPFTECKKHQVFKFLNMKTRQVEALLMQNAVHTITTTTQYIPHSVHIPASTKVFKPSTSSVPEVWRILFKMLLYLCKHHTKRGKANKQTYIKNQKIHKIFENIHRSMLQLLLAADPPADKSSSCSSSDGADSNSRQQHKHHLTKTTVSHVNDWMLSIQTVNMSYFSMRSFCDGPLEFTSAANCCFTFAIFLPRITNL